MATRCSICLQVPTEYESVMVYQRTGRVTHTRCEYPPCSLCGEDTEPGDHLDLNGKPAHAACAMRAELDRRAPEVSAETLADLMAEFERRGLVEVVAMRGPGGWTGTARRRGAE